MHLCFRSRPLSVAVALWFLATGMAYAQAPPLLPTLRDAVEAAWVLNPLARAQQNRQAELDARAMAAAALLPGPPSLLLSHRSDRIGSRGGLNDSEIEVATPLWNPGVRGATRSQVDADRAVLNRQQALAKIRLAGEVRELAGQAALARIEREVAQRKLQEARLLGADVERRVRVGEVARIDLLQAQAVQQVAATAEAQADNALARLLAQWRGLTGLRQIALLDESARTEAGAAYSTALAAHLLSTTLPSFLSAAEHPTLAAAQAQQRAARARLALTEADRRDPMEVGLGVVRERPLSGAETERSVKLSLRIPFGGDNRSAGKLAAARAELDQADAEGEAAVRAVAADQEAARADLATAREAQVLATERERLTREAQSLVAKAYRLGESDLPTRLRADNERFEAERASARATVEVRRAASKLNQALGLLP